jgi:hypothetical protein
LKGIIIILKTAKGREAYKKGSDMGDKASISSKMLASWYYTEKEISKNPLKINIEFKNKPVFIYRSIIDAFDKAGLENEIDYEIEQY